MYTTGLLERLVDTSADFALLFGTLQDAIARARQLVSSGFTGAEVQELLLDSRQVLAKMEQCAQLAPEDTRDSLQGLCDAADRNLLKLEQAVPREPGRGGWAAPRRAV
jgi:hypothetical protein